MRTILAGIVVLGLAGCGLRYTGTEQQMQQVARGAAELMKKDPNSGMVAAAGTGAHAALTAVMGQQEEEPKAFCVQMLSGCYASMEYGPRKDDWSGLPPDFYKTTSIGKD